MTPRACMLVVLLVSACSARVELQSADAGADGGVDGGADAGLDAPVELECPRPLVRCDGECVDLYYDVAHCGECGFDCEAVPHTIAPAGCSRGTCVFAGCEPGWASCSADPRQRCETSVMDPDQCGACDFSCHESVPVCARIEQDGEVLYQCREECPGGLTRCDNGCVDLSTDDANCGACGDACGAIPHGVLHCYFSLCRRAECAPGYHACGSIDGLSSTCVPDDDVASCGTRCIPCQTVPNRHVECADGECRLADCHAGFADCDGDVVSGCETDLSRDASCGACGNTCPLNVTACAPDGEGGFACVDACPPEAPTACGSACVDLQTTVWSCGACWRSCLSPANGRALCVDGECAVECDPGYYWCEGRGGCVDGAHPLACGPGCMQCPAPSGAVPTCDGVACGWECIEGRSDCDGELANGCETSGLCP